MERADFVSFVDALKECGIETYTARVEGGNLDVYHNSDNSMIFIKDNYIEVIKFCKNLYADQGGVYDVMRIPYENVDNVKAMNVTFEQGIALMEKFGNDSEELQAFYKSTIIKRRIKPGTSILDAMRDNEGKIMIPKGSSGYVVNGHVDNPGEEKTTPSEEENNESENGSGESGNSGNEGGGGIIVGPVGAEPIEESYDDDF